jgi:hypothetical protein
MYQAASLPSVAAVLGSYVFRQQPVAAPSDQDVSSGSEPRGAFLTGKKIAEAAWDNRWRSVAVAVGCQVAVELLRRRTRRGRKQRVEGTETNTEFARALRAQTFEHITDDADAAGGGEAILVKQFDRMDLLHQKTFREAEERAAAEMMCKLAAAREEGRREGLFACRLEVEDSEKAKLRSEREEMERQMLELRQRITSVCSERQRLATRLARATNEIQRKHAVVQPLEVARRKAEEELDQARNDIVSLREQLAVLRQEHEDCAERLKISDEANAHLKKDKEKARIDIVSLREQLAVLRQEHEDCAERLKISDEVNAQLKKEKDKPRQWGGLVQLRASPRPRQGLGRKSPAADTSSTEGALSADDGTEGATSESCTPPTSGDVSGSSKATTPRCWGGTASRNSLSPRTDSEVAHFQHIDGTGGELELELVLESDATSVASPQPGKSVVLSPRVHQLRVLEEQQAVMKSVVPSPKVQASLDEAAHENAASTKPSTAQKKFVVISPRVGSAFPLSGTTPRSAIGSEPSVWTRSPVDNSLIVDAIKAVPQSDSQKMRNKMASRRALLELNESKSNSPSAHHRVSNVSD